jgi:hypothetical protein
MHEWKDDTKVPYQVLGLGTAASLITCASFFIVVVINDNCDVDITVIQRDSVTLRL